MSARNNLGWLCRITSGTYKWLLSCVQALDLWPGLMSDLTNFLGLLLLALNAYNELPQHVYFPQTSTEENILAELLKYRKGKWQRKWSWEHLYWLFLLLLTRLGRFRRPAAEAAIVRRPGVLAGWPTLPSAWMFWIVISALSSNEEFSWYLNKFQYWDAIYSSYILLLYFWRLIRVRLCKSIFATYRREFE